MKLKAYIYQNYDSAKQFAEIHNVTPQLVSRWIREGYIVVDGNLYSPMRELIQKVEK